MKKHFLAILLLSSIVLLCLASCVNGTSSYSVTGKPTVSASKIDSILCNASSPACRTGKALYDLGVQYGIDPAIALAFFKHESGYGLNGVARITKSLGNIRCVDGFACEDGFAAFSTWSQGYKAWYELISGPLYVGDGLTTIPAIIHRYAPSSENDQTSYINDVEQAIDSYREVAA